jgi:hypothetical protein
MIVQGKGKRLAVRGLGSVCCGPREGQITEALVGTRAEVPS